MVLLANSAAYAAATLRVRHSGGSRNPEDLDPGFPLTRASRGLFPGGEAKDQGGFAGFTLKVPGPVVSYTTRRDERKVLWAR